MFEVSIGNHLEAIRDLLFYPVFSDSGVFLRFNSAKNHHALSVSVITRAMLESAAILYWILDDSNNHASKKINGYFEYIQLCQAIAMQEVEVALNNEQCELLEKNKDFRRGYAKKISGKELKLKHVREDYYLVIEKQLGNAQDPNDKMSPTKLVASFLEKEVKKENFDVLHFRKIYDLLSDFMHANPFALARLFSFEEPKKTQWIGYDQI